LNVRDALWLGTTGIGDQRRLPYVNPAFETIYGIRADEILRSDQAWLDILHPGDRERTLQALSDHQLISRAPSPPGVPALLTQRETSPRRE
jgi:hypothetical protein